MAVKVRTRFKFLLAKLQAAEADVASSALVAIQALRDLQTALDLSGKLDDKLGEDDVLGQRMGYYSDRLDPASAMGIAPDVDSLEEELRELARMSKRFLAASKVVNVDKLFRAFDIDESDGEEPDDDDETEDDDDDGVAELEALIPE